MDNSGNRSRNCSSDKFNEINQKSQNAVNKKFKIENEIKGFEQEVYDTDILPNKVDVAILKLPERYKQVFFLKYSHGLHDNKIAEIFKFNDIEEDNSFIITNIRHKELIKKANKNIEDAINTLKNNLPIDIISINIKDALENLGNITGENVSENIINEIFKKFCLGK